jgi:hypothetical protein
MEDIDDEIWTKAQWDAYQADLEHKDELDRAVWAEIKKEEEEVYDDLRDNSSSSDEELAAVVKVEPTELNNPSTPTDASSSSSLIPPVSTPAEPIAPAKPGYGEGGVLPTHFSLQDLVRSLTEEERIALLVQLSRHDMDIEPEQPNSPGFSSA